MPNSGRCATFWILWTLAAFAPTAATARQDEALDAALARPILKPGQPVTEVRSYLDGRLPRFEAPPSAEAWTATAEQLRQDVLAKVVFRGEAATWRDAKCKVEWLDTIDGGPGYRIRKLRYEAIPGFWIPALLYEPEKLDGKVPVVLNVNGHDANGKAADYKQIRCINEAKRGMLALNVEWVGMGQLRGEENQHGLINAIDLCGTSGIAIHYLAMSRALDLLLEHPHADADRVAVAGLSGGGWQTIFFSALDTRVTLSNPVAGYSGFRTRIHYLSDLGDSEQTPTDLATVADYTHLTAMRAPRPTLLTFNLKDNCCFAAPHALPPLIDAAWPIYAQYGKPNHLRVHVNEDPGTHNFLLDNRQAFYRMLGDHFRPDDKDDRADEIASDREVKTAEQLEVKLPETNLSLNAIARKLSDKLPKSNEGGTKAEQVGELKQTIRLPDIAWKAEKVGDESAGSLRIRRWTLRVNGAWTVPVVELTRGETSKGTTILLADRGRASAAKLAGERLDQGHTVLAIDPFYFGEAVPKERDYLWTLVLSTVGDRPLGLQAAQVAAVAQWARSRGDESVTVAAQGPRTSTVALVAAAVEEQAIGGLVLIDPLESLRTWIDRVTPYTAAPEQFCFGLLAHTDLPELQRRIAPRPIEIRRDESKAGPRP